MKTFNVILATDLNGGFALNNKLPWDLPIDFEFFKSITKHNTILPGINDEPNILIMGRKTWESMDCKPLFKRNSFVITSNFNKLNQKKLSNTIFFPDFISAYTEASHRVNSSVWVIGGKQIYDAALRHWACNKVYWTLIKGQFDADNFINMKDYPITWHSIIPKKDINKNDLFIGIKGEKFDGDNFAEGAIKKGAIAALISKDIKSVSNKIIVKDGREALGKIAQYWKTQSKLPLVAITGSNGKTTTKEMVGSILTFHHKSKAKLLMSQGNFNNDIGLPLSLLKVKKIHQCAVVEMGMNHEGEIRYFSEIAKPDIAVITNIAEAHIEFFAITPNHKFQPFRKRVHNRHANAMQPS